MATSTGKNIAKAGNRMVPNPNPEKNVSSDANNETKLIMTISIETKICWISLNSII